MSSEKVGHLSGNGGVRGPGFQFEPFPRLTRRLVSERPEGVKGAPLLGAAKRNLSQTAALIGATALLKRHNFTFRGFSQKHPHWAGSRVAGDASARNVLCAGLKRFRSSQLRDSGGGSGADGSAGGARPNAAGARRGPGAVFALRIEAGQQVLNCRQPDCFLTTCRQLADNFADT